MNKIIIGLLILILCIQCIILGAICADTDALHKELSVLQQTDNQLKETLEQKLLK